MFRKYFYLLPLIALGFFISSCDDNTTDPDPTVTGKIYIQSTPVGAQIWVDGNNSGKVTPDSVPNVTTGTRSVTLKLSGYRDTTFTMNVVQNTTVSKSVTLTSTLSTVTYTNVRIWEITGTTAAQPSGLSLVSGRALSTSTAGQKDSVDIYYFSNATTFELRTPTSAINSRTTKFLSGGGTNLTDGVDASTVSGSWLNQLPDTQSNYFFLYDQDGHYSKMIITNLGGGTPGNPAYMDVTWIYNLTAGDVRF